MGSGVRVRVEGTKEGEKRVGRGDVYGGRGSSEGLVRLDGRKRIYLSFVKNRRQISCEVIYEVMYAINYRT